MNIIRHLILAGLLAVASYHVGSDTLALTTMSSDIIPVFYCAATGFIVCAILAVLSLGLFIGSYRCTATPA